MKLKFVGDGTLPKVELNLEVFDFDNPKSWDKVLSVAEHPLVLRALDAGMMTLCRENRTEWVRERGPWSYSDQHGGHWEKLQRSPPEPNSPAWYRIYGDRYSRHTRHALSPWAAAVGSLLFPDREWSVAYSFRVRSTSSHSAGYGIKEEGKLPSVIIMDLLLGQRALQKRTERKLLTMLLRSPSNSYPVQIAIAKLECGENIHHEDG